MHMSLAANDLLKAQATFVEHTWRRSK